MQNVLILGYGKQGQRHHAAINQLLDNGDIYDYTVDTYDSPEGVITVDYHKYTHILICTPLETHANIILDILGTNRDCKIFCEKPVVINPEDLNLCHSVYAGMCERLSMNQTIISAARKDKIRAIHFIRKFELDFKSAIKDKLIHDIDLVVECLGRQDYSFEIDIPSRLIYMTYGDAKVIFDFSEMDIFNPKYIRIATEHSQITISQQTPTLVEQMRRFLSGYNLVGHDGDAHYSHTILCDILSRFYMMKKKERGCRG